MKTILIRNATITTWNGVDTMLVIDDDGNVKKAIIARRAIDPQIKFETIEGEELTK